MKKNDDAYIYYYKNITVTALTQNMIFNGLLAQSK